MKGLLIGTLFIAVSPQIHAIDNEPDGFRGIKWGEMLSNHKPEFVYQFSDKNEKYYRRKNDKPSLGAVELKSIYYVFYKDRFMSVVFRSAGESNRSALISTFNTQFGPPDRGDANVDNYFWFGPKSRISVDCNVIDSSCMASIWSKEISDIESAELAEAAKGAGKDF